jgi:hypothetical protein
MDIIIESVKKIEEMVEHCGVEEGDVILDTNPDNVNCQYERGACLVASFGGKTAEFVTDNPVRARTKLSFMFGVPLEAPQARSAAASILNVLAGFFALTRIQHSCKASDHAPCLECLRKEIEGKQIMCYGSITAVERELRQFVVNSPEEADIILFNGEGIASPEAGDIVKEFGTTKRIICVGPSTSGIARLNQIENWCPYGK